MNKLKFRGHQNPKTVLFYCFFLTVFPATDKKIAKTVDGEDIVVDQTKLLCRLTILIFSEDGQEGHRRHTVALNCPSKSFGGPFSLVKFDWA